MWHLSSGGFSVVGGGGNCGVLRRAVRTRCRKSCVALSYRSKPIWYASSTASC